MPNIPIGVIPRAQLYYSNGNSGNISTMPFPTDAVGTIFGQTGGYGLRVGEIMTLAIFFSNGGGGTVTTPTGWTRVTSTTMPNSNLSGGFQFFWKVATASDIAAGSVSLTTAGGGPMGAWLNTYSNVDSTNPIAAFSVAASTNASGKYTQPGSVTPSGAGDLPCVYAGGGQNALIYGNGVPQGYAVIGYAYPPNGYGNHAGFHGQLVVDSTIALNPTFTWATGAGDCVTLIVVLKAAAPVALPLPATERSNIGSAFGASVVEAAVTGGTPFPAVTLIQALQLIASVTYGVNSGAATNAPVYSDASGTKQRIAATLDGNLNRTGLTFSFT